ncbi:fMet-Leu-Phe receptor [Biomphalaria glabrata]|nr:fMet-Leu-Phe receptor [Biomphalaria glabrata]
MTMTLTLQFDPRVNSTRFVFWVAPGREQARVWTWIVRNATLPISTLVVIVCCVFHMSKHLLISYRFRHQQQSLNLTDHSPDRNTLATDAKKATKLVVKERRVIQQMVVMSVVVIACDVLWSAQASK